MINRPLTSLAILFGTAAFTADAAPTAIGRYDDWTVFTESVNGETLCYAATEATDKAPKASDHGDVWFFVSNWKSGKARSQPSLKVGYELRADLPARASVGRSGWTLYGVGKEAFAQDQDDPRLVSALRKGSELRVEAVSARDTKVSYHFSLSGSANAIDKASSLCR
ncbi:MAG: invasion associated locus B family protein [Henriciella sp.]|uniref:invasion associated locus B family protein n=1 Tax=Henriciella sp. TaxID=1968823 RepID=UPI002621A2E0|nr:invasion associated locus B family protein [Henriciella sp.]